MPGLSSALETLRRKRQSLDLEEPSERTDQRTSPIVIQDRVAIKT